MDVMSWYYCSPQIIAMAVLMFLFFKSFHFHSKVINELAKAAFLCYLIQGYIIPRLGIAIISKYSLFLLFLHLLVSVVVIYLISYILCKLYDLTFGHLFSKLDKITIPYTK